MPSKVIDLSGKGNKKKANSQAISHLIAESRDESAPSRALPVMLPLFPRVLPWAGCSLPLSGAHAAVRLGNCDITKGMPLLLDYELYCNRMK